MKMKKNIFSVAKSTLAAGAIALMMASCNRDESPGSGNTQIDPNEVTFNIGYGVGYRGTAQGVILPTSNEELISATREIDFSNEGFKLEDSRTHRLYSTNNGKDVYFLSYLENAVHHHKFTSFTKPNYYTNSAPLDAKAALGGSNGRWKVVDENTALIYGVSAQAQKDANGNFTKMQSTLRIAAVDLKNFSLGGHKTIVLPEENNPNLPNQHIWRIDQPVIVGGKVYIGVAKQGYDPTISGNNKSVSGEDKYGASTLVLDYPSFENPKIIESTIGKGQTYGYRTPSYIEYNGSVYHTNMNESKIFKITNGQYDNAYDFDIAKALGMNKVGGTGIFYVNNGIAYMPFYDAEKGSGTNAKAWGIARVDLKNKTAIKMNLPEGLWLHYYQSAKAVGDKLYMAINPLGQEGNIYIFDATKADANGFTKGAKLKVTAEGFYIGVF